MEGYGRQGTQNSNVQGTGDTKLKQHKGTLNFRSLQILRDKGHKTETEKGQGTQN